MVLRLSTSSQPAGRPSLVSKCQPTKKHGETRHMDAFTERLWAAVKIMIISHNYETCQPAYWTALSWASWKGFANVRSFHPPTTQWWHPVMDMNSYSYNQGLWEWSAVYGKCRGALTFNGIFHRLSFEEFVHSLLNLKEFLKQSVTDRGVTTAKWGIRAGVLG